MTLCASACEPVFFPFIGILAETVTSIRLSLVNFPPNWKTCGCIGQTPLTGRWLEHFCLWVVGGTCWALSEQRRALILTSPMLLSRTSGDTLHSPSPPPPLGTLVAKTGHSFGVMTPQRQSVLKGVAWMQLRFLIPDMMNSSVWIVASCFRVVTSEFWMRYLKEQLIPSSEVRVYFLPFRLFLSSSH